MADDLLQAQFPADGLSSRLLPSMKSRARALFTNVNLQIPARNAAPLVSPLPPWFKVETYICIDFLPTSVSSQTNQNVLQMYHKLIGTNYSGYTHIFTNGSCIVEPTCSASAAVVIPSRGVTINFKLRPQIHIMECELIAINEALQWVLLNNCQEEKYVIFSDSLSSLHLIQNTRPKNYLPLVFNIQDKLFNIASSHWNLGDRLPPSHYTYPPHSLVHLLLTYLPYSLNPLTRLAALIVHLQATVAIALDWPVIPGAGLA
ncbi:Ribonuclease H-like domain [Trinorchestia longiramus]|nr:Ribonuclease H-like domain [Trinorchestia longiramus]